LHSIDTFDPLTPFPANVNRTAPVAPLTA